MSLRPALDRLLRGPAASPLLVGVAAALVFANSLSNGFAYDDIHIVVEDGALHDLGGLPGRLLEPYWSGGHAQALGLWRPVTTGVLGLLWSAGGGSPLPFHALNVLAHSVASVLALLLLARLLPAGAALAGALVFAVHPVHVEAVANVVGAAELLSAVPFLWACLLFLRWSGDLGPARVAALCGLYALAVLAKESAITLPGVLFLLDGARRDVRVRDTLSYARERAVVYGAMAVTAGVLLAARHAVLGSVASPLPPLGADVLAEIPRIWTVAQVWPHYVRLLFFPLELSADYAPGVIPIAWRWTAMGALGAALAVVFLFGALASWRDGPLGPSGLSARAAGFAVMWFVVTIAPVANLLFLSGVLLAERTLYLPSVGFALGAGWMLGTLTRERRRAGWALFAATVALLGLRSWTRAPTWKDNSATFTTVMRHHPESGRAQWFLGETLIQRGHLREGLAAYRRATGLLGSHPPLLANVASRLMDAGEYDRAERLFAFMKEVYPESTVPWERLAVLYARQDRHEEAVVATREALAATPEHHAMHHILSVSLAALGRLDEALEARWGAIRAGHSERWQEWIWLAELQTRAGRPIDARAALDSAAARTDSEAAVRHIDSLRTALGAPIGGL